MARFALTDPLSHPVAIALAGLVLVLGVKLLPPGWLLAAPLAVAVAFALASQRREATLPDLIRRCRQLSAGADAVAIEAGERLTQADSMGRLTAIQFCCQRVKELPSTLERLRVGEVSARSTLLSASHLEQRLRKERQRLARESGTELGRQRERLVRQLEHNLSLAQQGTEAGSLRVMALSEQLESLAGDLQALQVQLRQPVLPALPPWSADDAGLTGDPSRDPLTADLIADIDELDQLLQDALGGS
jgi:hypothetical protein